MFRTCLAISNGKEYGPHSTHRRLTRLLARLFEVVVAAEQLDYEVEEIAKDTPCLDLSVEVCKRIVRLSGTAVRMHVNDQRLDSQWHH